MKPGLHNEQWTMDNIKDTQNNVERSMGNIICKEEYKKTNKKNPEVKKLILMSKLEPWWRLNKRWQQNKKNKNHGEISTP